MLFPDAKPTVNWRSRLWLFTQLLFCLAFAAGALVDTLSFLHAKTLWTLPSINIVSNQLLITSFLLTQIVRRRR